MKDRHLVICELCPKNCSIPDGQSGDCRVRVNMGGKLIAVTYGRPCSIHIDPMEKKPLFHFLPSTPIFSIATAGCNLHCKNCQNWQISQANPYDIDNFNLSPKMIVNLAIRKSCQSIAYTYSEPTVFYEYVYDTAVYARERGIKNVLVTAGYINPKPQKKICRYIDASNTDLKGFNEGFYRSNCFATLRPVLDGMVIAREMGVWLEITNLVIPTLNDDLTEVRRMCKWIKKNLGDYIPLHFSRFHPQYRLRNLPPTPLNFLRNARKEAMNTGLKYVYIGNVIGEDGENTYCPNDGKLLIGRIGFTITAYSIINGRCKVCNEKIEGVWKS